MKVEETSVQEIERLLSKLNKPSRYIGDYISHEETTDGNILVTLTTGNILLYHAEIKTADNVPDYRIPDIVARFKSAPR